MVYHHLLNLTLEFDTAALRRRFFEVLPGALSWLTLLTLAVLAVIVPFWMAVFVIVYDVYVLIRAAYMAVHLVYAYRRMQRMKKIDWLARCRHAHTDMPWPAVHHIIVLPTYNESLKVLRTSLASLAATHFPRERLHVVVGFEERIGERARQRAAILQSEFQQKFGTFLTTFHPDNLPGEKRVKSANANFAIKRLEELVVRRGVPIDHILVSNFDCDTVVDRSYFAHLTYAFITHPDRYRVSYQPLPVYNNNLWDAPAFSRVIATGSTFWQMIESTRPERLVTFSSHAMTLRALKAVGYWQADVVSEDSRIFWQCLLHYNGRYRTEPLYTAVSMDAALAKSWIRTFINQYKQKRRWAWGIENFPFMAEGFLRRRRIPLRTKITYTIRTLEGHYSWATTAVIVAGLGWLPVMFGTPQFHATVLSYSLPFIARTIMSVAMVGLLVSTAISLLLMPPKPARYSRWRYVPMTLQWALVPIIATVLSAIPALDAETRLMFGRDLAFNVMEKNRRG